MSTNQQNSDDGFWLSKARYEAFVKDAKDLTIMTSLAATNLLRGLLGGFGVGFMTGALFAIWMMEINS